MKIKSIILLLFLGVSFLFTLNAGSTGKFIYKKKKAKIYHKGWIDLNKNGKKDIYEDPRVSINKRLDDLITQMNP